MLTNGNLALQAIDRAIINRDITPPRHFTRFKHLILWLITENKPYFANSIPSMKIGRLFINILTCLAAIDPLPSTQSVFPINLVAKTIRRKPITT